MKQRGMCKGGPRAWIAILHDGAIVEAKLEYRGSAHDAAAALVEREHGAATTQSAAFMVTVRAKNQTLDRNVYAYRVRPITHSYWSPDLEKIE